MNIGTFRVGSPRKPGEGLRVGTVRFLPRGVKKEDYARLDYFEMKKTDARQAIKLLGELARATPLGIGCYCEKESACHRSILRELLEQSAGL